MGQQQSSEKPAGVRSSTPQTDRERKVNRRVSIQALQQTRGQPADPTASNTTAVAQGTSHNVEKHNLQHMLQSTSPEYNKNARIERSTSRASREKKDTEPKNIPVRSPPAAVSPPSAETIPSGNIDIPVATTAARSRPEETQAEFRAYQERHYTPLSQLRPPRMPIPIAETAQPDSPTLHPIDVSNADVPLFETDDPISAIEPSVRRKSSFQSEATQEEEEMGEELQPFPTETGNAVVATEIEWNQPGERVFVTGTFATWDRKYRLHDRRDGQSGKVVKINLPPGTHHLKFWVDNQMVTSPDLPTAVDFNNVLVNYIEISTDDIPRQRRESTQPPTGKPLPTQAGASVHLDENEDQRTHSDPTGYGEDDDGEGKIQLEELPLGDFRQIVPQYLQDIDHEQGDHQYQQAVSVISDMNPPPSLPMFLNRSILNGNTPVKDDSSVLPLPNHTVLNHLMTSSVKNGVLATSVTTRYNRKHPNEIQPEAESEHQNEGKSEGDKKPEEEPEDDNKIPEDKHAPGNDDNYEDDNQLDNHSMPGEHDTLQGEPDSEITQQLAPSHKAQSD